MATEEDQLFSLCCIRQFLPQYNFFRILRSELIVKKLNQSKVSNTGSVHYTLQADIQLTGIQL